MLYICIVYDAVHISKVLNGSISTNPFQTQKWIKQAHYEYKYQVDRMRRAAIISFYQGAFIPSQI